MSSAPPAGRTVNTVHTVHTVNTVHTVLGPVPAESLGVVAVHEALLSVVPGAQYAYDISFDRAEIFAAIVAQVRAFKAAGGGTIVDSTGMFHGRDLSLLEALSRATGIHIVASTGMGPEETLGGYFLTPQTNPPTPWPAEKFADLFAKEISEGMVVPRLERRAPAGLVATEADRGGMTATEESLFRGGARAAQATGVPLSIRFGADAAHDLDIVLDEGLPADRVVVGGLDRRDAVAAGMPHAVAARGAYLAIDHVGRTDDEHLSDDERVALVIELVRAGHVDRILLSSNSIGVAKGHSADEVTFSAVLATFVPRLRAAGVGEADLHRILVTNPADLLTVRASEG
jgi:predicted metal-dependent phosphotriesterase family hydrolase